MQKSKQAYLQQSNQTLYKIKLVLKQNNSEFIFDKNATDFCELFSPDTLLIPTQSPHCPQQISYFVVQIPPEAQLEPQHILLFKQFIQIHENNLGLVKIGKINILNNYEQLGEKTKQFIQKVLEPMSTKQVTSFIQTLKYLRADKVENVAYTYLAKKLALPASQLEVQKVFNELQIKPYDKYQLAQLKQQMFSYFQNFGNDLAQEYDEKKQEIKIMKEKQYE